MSKVSSHYVALIQDWAEARNFFKGATAYGQFFKLVSELGEWSTGVLTDDRDEVIDGLGDAFVVTTIMAKQLGGDILPLIEASQATLPRTDLSILAIVGVLGDSLAKEQVELSLATLGDLGAALVYAAERRGLDINTCLSRAYSDIKDRVGVMYNGIYIKSTDPRYAEIMAELAPAPEPVVAKFGE